MNEKKIKSFVKTVLDQPSTENQKTEIVSKYILSLLPDNALQFDETNYKRIDADEDDIYMRNQPLFPYVQQASRAERLQTRLDDFSEFARNLLGDWLSRADIEADFSRVIRTMQKRINQIKQYQEGINEKTDDPQASGH